MINHHLLTPATSLAFATDTSASKDASLVFFDGSLQDNMTSPNRRDTNDPLVTISTALCLRTSEIARIRAGRAAADTEPTVDITRPITLADASACEKNDCCRDEKLRDGSHLKIALHQCTQRFVGTLLLWRSTMCYHVLYTSDCCSRHSCIYSPTALNKRHQNVKVSIYV